MATQTSSTKKISSAAEALGAYIIYVLLSLLVIMIFLTAIKLWDSLKSLKHAGVFQPAALTAGCQVSNRYPQEVLKWCDQITAYAQQNGLEPDLLAALVWLESGGNPQAYSKDGAVGLMQVMPSDGKAAAFLCKGLPCFQNRPTIDELKDPDYNLSYGTQMLHDLLESSGGDLREALKAYGPIGVGYSYADTILDIFERYASQENTAH